MSMPQQYRKDAKSQRLGMTRTSAALTSVASLHLCGSGACVHRHKGIGSKEAC